LRRIFRHKAPQSHNQPNDFFLADLAGTPNAVMRQAAHLREWREFCRRDELRFRHIKVKHLREGR
jgi:predicted alpha/beta hydrolase